MSDVSDQRPVWISRLVSELSGFLQEPVELVDEGLVDDDAFSCLIRGAPPGGEGFQLCWEGILGMQPIDEKPYASAVIFLFSRESRLAVEGQEASYLYLRYEGSVEHGGQWVSFGWCEDEYEEYAGYDYYGD